jgi:hypothetical protein
MVVGPAVAMNAPAGRDIEREKIIERDQQKVFIELPNLALASRRP